MEELIQGFIDEALQLIEDLDTILVELNAEDTTDEQVQEIFRIMHTIKGGSGMFQFTNIEKLTHQLEDAYDLIRDKKLQLNDDIVSLTLKTSDVLKDLLHARDGLDDDLQNDYNAIIEQVKGILPLKEVNTEEEDGFGFFDEEPLPTIAKSEHIYYVCFKPDHDVLKRGLVVPNLFEEIEELGEVTGLPFLDNIPHPQDFDPATFYLSWDLFIKTTCSIEDVEDCFMFYMSHEFKTIEIKDKDLSKNDEFKELCVNINNGQASVSDLQDVLDRFSSEKEIKTIKAEPVAQELVKKAKKVSNSIKVDASKLDELVNLVSDLVTLNSRLELFANESDDDFFKKTVKSVSKLSKRFRDNALELRLIPVKVLELKMQRLIRDLSKSLNKEVEFMVDGTNTELDKNIIARLEGPLMHILRNSLDHGLESTEERIKAEKPKKGVIRFISFYSGSNVFIQIQDDGGGIDPDKIKQKAIEKGLLKADETIEKHEIFNLLFKPGFSTAKEITNVSGRGVGLDVVKNEIQNMRGEIDIESEVGLGTSFTLKLPLTLSIIDTLMTQVGNTKILIPREYIIQTNLHKKNGKALDQIEYEGIPIPVVSLRKEIVGEESSAEKEHLIIVSQNDKNYAFSVDKIYGEHQAVVKPLGYYNSEHKYFSSASVMGDGNLALILDVAKVINNKRSKSNLGNYNLK